MAKTGLGRGLEHLMNGSKPADKPAQPALPLSDGNETNESHGVGPGLSSLLEGPRSREAGPPPGSDTGTGSGEESRAGRRLIWSLLAADLLFIALAIRIVSQAGGRMGVVEAVLVVGALGLGAWLACCAFLLRR